MHPDDEAFEAAAALENELIAAAQALIEDHGYSLSDIMSAIESSQ